MSGKYRAAVIGCGRIGLTMELDDYRIKPATHAGAFASNPRTDLCALVDQDIEKIKTSKSIFPDVTIFQDAKEMLESCHPDIVSVATQPESHREIVDLCAREKTPAIICEKPIAISEKDGMEMIKICRENGAMLFINHSRRFDHLLRQLAEQINSGSLGILNQVTCYYTAGLFNTGTHLVDLILLLIGKGRKIQSVRALSDLRFSAPPGDLNVNAWLICDDGLVVSLQILEVKYYSIFEIHLYGSKKALKIDRFGFSSEWTSVIDCQEFSGYHELDRINPVRENKSRSFFPPMVEHVVDCLERKSEPISSGEDGLKVLKILSALKESAKNNGENIYLN
jgi:predicted dehydrogenase